MSSLCSSVLCLSPETTDTLLTLGAGETDLTVVLGIPSDGKAPCNPLTWEQLQQNEQCLLLRPSWAPPKSLEPWLGFSVVHGAENQTVSHQSPGLFYLIAPPSSTQIFYFRDQGGCLCSSHHVPVPTIRKGKGLRKSLFTLSKDTS